MKQVPEKLSRVFRGLKQDQGVQSSAHSSVLPLEDRYDLLLTAARELHMNGEETRLTMLAIKRLSGRLGVQASLLPTWSALFLQLHANHLRGIAASPTNINMNRVVAVQQSIETVCKGQIDETEAKTALITAGRASTSNLWLFVLACTIGAGALSVIWGVMHVAPFILISLCAAVGAFLRRGITKFSNNSVLQIFVASLLAGIVGAFAVRWNISAERLVALGPCLVLVPGPHILNGMFDLAELRLSLGAARLGFAALTILAISAGIVIGLALVGTTLPASGSSPELSLWTDMLCAGIAAASYSVFYATPLRMMLYLVLTGMLAHAIRWFMLLLHMNIALATGLACLVVGIILVPVCRRHRLPFAAVGFASVVAMVPGVYLFRMSSGFVQIQTANGNVSASLIGSVLSDGVTAIVVVLAMTLGLVLPMRVYNYFVGQ